MNYEVHYMFLKKKRSTVKNTKECYKLSKYIFQVEKKTKQEEKEECYKIL